MTRASKRKILDKVIRTRSKCKKLEEEEKIKKNKKNNKTTLDDEIPGQNERTGRVEQVLTKNNRNPIKENENKDPNNNKETTGSNVLSKNNYTSNKENYNQEYEEKEDEEEEEVEEDDEASFEKFPELQKFMSLADVKKMFDYYERELLMVDETPEERKQYEDDPERDLVVMRNTSSSDVMMGLLAEWIKEVKTIKVKEPNVALRKLFALTFAAFFDDHWIWDNGNCDVVYFLVHEFAKIWKWLLARTNAILRISLKLRTELIEKLKEYSKKLKSFSSDWDHPIEFILSKTKLKYKLECYTLDEIIRTGKWTKKIKMQTYAEMDKIWKK